MQYDVKEASEILRATPGTLRALLGDLGGSWARSNYGPGTFSPFDVVGHLVHGERTDWIPRARIILEYGEARPFEPFDRFAQYGESRGKSLGQLLRDFEVLRAESLFALEAFGLGAEELALTGIHPEFGRVTLRAHLASWVVHDLSHIAQIVRGLAHQYRHEVGPWKAYLPIVRP